MANNFIKWWKTKIVNGYRQFSGSNGYSSSHKSDTERLLGNDSVCNLGLGTNDLSCSTPPNPANYNELKFLPNNENEKINVEKYSYVSMESELDQSGQDRQEFSFTLYDFDGHGKITKDDIAGLVTTIYETLRSYVQVPYYGSKTIKVQLIITPNQKKQKTAVDTDRTQEKKCTEEPKNNVRHIKQDVNVNNKNPHRKVEHCKNDKKPKQDPCCCSLSYSDKSSSFNICDENVDCVDYCSKISYNETNEKYEECYDNQLKQRTYTSKPYSKYTAPQNQKYSLRNTQSRRLSVCPVFCTKTWRSKNRSSSIQRQELLEIIQANMDKNNYRFQSSRRKQIPKHLTYLPQMSVSDYEQQPEEKYTSPRSTLKLNDIANMMSSQNYLINLANLSPANLYKFNQTNKLKLPYSQYDKLLNAVVSMSNKHINSNPFHRPSQSHQNCKCGRHYRVKSNEISQTPQQNNISATKRMPTNKRNSYCTNEFLKRSRHVETLPSRSKCCETKFEPTPSIKKQSKKFARTILNHSNSPHHLKHQNRQEDQARAMAQVVRWLEKEVSTNVTIKSRLEKKLNKSKSYYTSDKNSPVNFKITNPNLKYQRHKHHHVHEYIHHHYHHF